MNIYEKLSNISTELMTVAKNLEVGAGKNKYSAVGEADVLRAVKPLEAKYKVYSYPVKRNILESGTIENEGVDYNSQQKIVKKSFFVRIETVYRFVNIEKPDEFADMTTYGDGVDSQDKSVGKAMTYCDKYALLKAYKIITGDDPDQEPSNDLKGAKITPRLDKNLLAEASNINIDLQKVAAYLGKTVEQLTNDELKSCIAQKKQALEAKKNE